MLRTYLVYNTVVLEKKSLSRLSGGCGIIITSGKKVLVVCLAGAWSLLRPEKKVLVVCLVGARSLLRPEKKVLVVCLADAWSSLRPEKKVLVVCLAGAQCIEFECNDFVLVLVQIDLIHFEHSICIRSIWIKTDTNLLVQFKLKLIHIRYQTDLHIEVNIRILLKDK